MRAYFKRLKDHPGVPVALAIQIAGALAGIANESMDALTGAIFGFTVFSLWWIPVLWTNRKED